MPAAKKSAIKDRIEKWITPTWRFQKRSGATTKAEHNARKALFNRLVEMGQLDVIRQLEGNHVTWQELRQADRANRLSGDHLGADIALAKRLWTHEDQAQDEGAFMRTLPTMGSQGPVGALSRRRYALVFGQLLSEYGAAGGLSLTSRVKDLRTTDWLKVFARMGHLSASSRNGVRLVVSVFLSRFLGNKHHPFRHAVCAAMGTQEPDRAKPKVVHLLDFARFYAALNDAVKPTALVLALSGIRIAEYLQLTEAHIRDLPFIEVPGYEDLAAVPDVPAVIALARQAIPCRLGPTPVYEPGHYPGAGRDGRYQRIRVAFLAASEATGLQITPHALRHFFAQIAISKRHGGQQSLQVMHALRHATPDMTGVYTRMDNAREVADAVGAALASILATLAPAPEVSLTHRVARRVEDSLTDVG